MTWTVTYTRFGVTVSFDVNHAGIADTICRALLKDELVASATYERSH